MLYEFSQGGVYDLVLMRRKQYLQIRTADNHREALGNPTNATGREQLERAKVFYSELQARLFEEKTELDLVGAVFGGDNGHPYGEAVRYTKSLQARAQCTFFAALDALGVIQCLSC